MKHTPREEVTMLPKGQYEAVVKSAREMRSKNDNDMIELIVTVFAPTGERVDVFDYLVGTDSMAWKIRHFCESAGLDYDAGEIAEEDAKDRNVRVNLTIEKNEKYGEKNKISDYLPRPNGVAVKPVAQDADIPF